MSLLSYINKTLLLHCVGCIGGFHLCHTFTILMTVYFVFIVYTTGKLWINFQNKHTYRVDTVMIMFFFMVCRICVPVHVHTYAREIFFSHSFICSSGKFILQTFEQFCFSWFIFLNRRRVFISRSFCTSLSYTFWILITRVYSYT